MATSDASPGSEPAPAVTKAAREDDRGALAQWQDEQRLQQTRPVGDLVGLVGRHRLAPLGEARDGYHLFTPTPPAADLVQQDAPDVGVRAVRLPDGGQRW